jgi:hypothetical protein
LLHEFRVRLGLLRPVRKIYYNMTITGLSVAVALIIGTLELLSVLTEEDGYHQRPARVHRQAGSQQCWIRDRRTVRTDLDCRPRRVAVRPDRGAVDAPNNATRIAPCLFRRAREKERSAPSSSTAARFRSQRVSDERVEARISSCPRIRTVGSERTSASITVRLATGAA